MSHHSKNDFRQIFEMVESFLGWLNKKGYYSYDQYDFWSTAYGRLAKSFYYKNSFLGIPFVAPLFFLELFFPDSRAFVVQKKRFPIADAHFILGYLVS